MHRPKVAIPLTTRILLLRSQVCFRSLKTQTKQAVLALQRRACVWADVHDCSAHHASVHTEKGIDTTDPPPPSSIASAYLSLSRILCRSLHLAMKNKRHYQTQHFKEGNAPITLAWDDHTRATRASHRSAWDEHTHATRAPQRSAWVQYRVKPELRCMHVRSPARSLCLWRMSCRNKIDHHACTRLW